MGKNDKTGRNLKFYLQPADEFEFNEAMQKDGFSARGPYLMFLVRQRDGMRKAQEVLSAWTKYREAEAGLKKVSNTDVICKVE